MPRLLLFALTVLLIAGCSSGSSFDFAEDDLCEWVSEAEVASFVTEAYERSGVEWEGTVAAVPANGSAWDLRGDYCQWELTGGGYVVARGLTPQHFGNRPFLSSEFENEEDPVFDDNIIVGNAAFGRYGFWVDGSDDALGLEMILTAGVGPNDWDLQEMMLFSVANGFLDEMGWTSSEYGSQ